MTLPTDVKNQWVDALRSGRYEQGVGGLRTQTDDGDRYCCLGVLCDILPEVVWEAPSEASGDRRYTAVYVETTDDPDDLPERARHAGYLPYDLANALGLSVENTRAGQTQTNLASLNDTGASFAHIADVMEETF